MTLPLPSHSVVNSWLHFLNLLVGTGGALLGPPAPKSSHLQAKPAHLPQHPVMGHILLFLLVASIGLQVSLVPAVHKLDAVVTKPCTEKKEGPGGLKIWMVGMSFKARARP